MDFKTDNFDKEFDLNKQTAKKKAQGKLPSWLLILAGAAMIGGVVAARQPDTGTSDPVPVRSVSLPAGETVSGDPLVFSGVNDEKADSSELIAHFISQGGNGAQYVVPLRTVGNSQKYAMELDPLEMDSDGYIVPPADQSMDSSIVWVDEKPYALTILPTDETKPAEGASSVYWLNGNPYEVTLEPLSDADLSGLKDTEMSGVIRIGDQSFRMSMRAVDPSSVKAEAPVILSPDVLSELKLSPTPETEAPALVLSPERDRGEEAEVLPGKSVPDADAPAVVKLGEKSYSVTVRPAGEVAPGAGSGEAVQTARFEMNGSTYELELKELSPESAGGDLSSGILWVGDVPLQVRLANEADAAGAAGTGTQFEISLDSLPAEQTAELRRNRFGENDGAAAAESDPFPAETEVPAVVPTEPAQASNWFSDLFTGFFGAGPTEVPTPQVTVIALTPTPAAVQPTATPIIIRMAEAAVPQEPVRLDGENDPEGAPGIPEGEAKAAPEVVVPSVTETVSTGKPTEPEVAVTVQPTKSAPEKIAPVIVESFDDVAAPEPSEQTETKELPQTGLAEGWNIPSLLALLGGLLLVIIGVRKLRNH